MLAWGRRDLDSLQGSFWFEDLGTHPEILKKLHSVHREPRNAMSFMTGLLTSVFASSLSSNCEPCVHGSSVQVDSHVKTRSANGAGGTSETGQK